MFLIFCRLLLTSVSCRCAPSPYLRPSLPCCKLIAFDGSCLVYGLSPLHSVLAQSNRFATDSLCFSSEDKAFSLADSTFVELLFSTLLCSHWRESETKIFPPCKQPCCGSGADAKKGFLSDLFVAVTASILTILCTLCERQSHSLLL